MGRARMPAPRFGVSFPGGVPEALWDAQRGLALSVSKAGKCSFLWSPGRGSGGAVCPSGLSRWGNCVTLYITGQSGAAPPHLPGPGPPGAPGTGGGGSAGTGAGTGTGTGTGTGAAAPAPGPVPRSRLLRRLRAGCAGPPRPAGPPGWPRARRRGSGGGSWCAGECGGPGGRGVLGEGDPSGRAAGLGLRVGLGSAAGDAPSPGGMFLHPG